MQDGQEHRVKKVKSSKFGSVWVPHVPPCAYEYTGTEPRGNQVLAIKTLSYNRIGAMVVNI